MLYHNKTLFEGYSGTYPLLYWHRTQLLTLNFPSEETLKLLRVWGVETVVIHRDQFPDPLDYDQIIRTLHILGIPTMISTPMAEAFDLTTRTVTK